MNNELTDVIIGHNPRFYPKLLFFFGEWFAAAAAGWPLLLLPNAFLCCFFVRTVWNNTNQGWKLTPSIQPTVDTILTVASNYVYSIHYLSEWSFQPAGSPVQGALLVRAVLAHSFLLCLVSVYKPTTCIVFLFTTRVLTSPFFQVVQRDAMQDGEDSDSTAKQSICFLSIERVDLFFVVFPGISWNLLDIWLDIYEMPPILSPLNKLSGAAGGPRPSDTGLISHSCSLTCPRHLPSPHPSTFS